LKLLAFYTICSWAAKLSNFFLKHENKFYFVPNFLSMASEIFLFTTPSRKALGPTQPPIQWVPGALSLVVKRPGSEADHSPPSSAEVKKSVELYLYSPIRLHGVVLS
jgi:hypothetical protein